MKTCNKCNAKKLSTEFYRNKNYADGLQACCKVCKKSMDKKNYDIKSQDPDWAIRHNTRLRNWNRLKSTGFTPELFEQKLNEQENKCAICKTSDPGATNWHADHCHYTGQQRGILCKKCNTGIGMLNDDIELVESALIYLKHYKETR